jgi:Tfp pilus assembly protein FimT
MMAISVPTAMKTQQTYRLQSAARHTASKMQAARIEAITRNLDCRLNVISGVAYVVECQEGGWKVIDHVTMPHGITVSANNKPEFHRRGNVSPAATFTLSDTYGRKLQVVVNVNGRVRVQ